MKKVILIMLMVWGISGCSNHSDAEHALDSAGFSEIATTGYKFFACDDSDFFHTGFTARNPAGKMVSGTVCSGLIFKDSTIRF